MQEPYAQAKDDRDGCIQCELAQADGDVGRAEAEVESCAVQLTNCEQCIDACIEQKHLVEDDKVCRPRMLEPTKIDGQAQSCKNEKVAPVAVLIRVDSRGLPHEDGDRDRQKGVELQPTPMKRSA